MKKTITRDGSGKQKQRNIRIAYAVGSSVPVDRLNELQGDLKELSDESYAKLSGEITGTGFAFAPHVWRNPKDKKLYLLDGHQRIKTLRRLMRDSNYRIENIPVIVVEAKTEKAARRRVLQATSQYGKITPQGLSEFIAKADISIQELSAFDLPTIDMDKMLSTFNPGEDDAARKDDDNSEIEAGEFTKLVHECPKCGHKFSRE